MFFSEAALERVDQEKGLFDFARMLVTILAFIGICAVVWTVWSLQNLELAVGQSTRYLPIVVPSQIKWVTLAVAIITSLFTAFLWWRTMMISRDVALINMREQQSIGGILLGLLMAALVMTLPICVVIALSAVIEGVHPI